MLTSLNRLLLAAVLFTASGAMAQSFPSRPVKIVVAFGAGGLADVLARRMGEIVAREWRQPVIIENKVGGNTIIATQYVAAAAPDGYTVHFGTLQTPFVTHAAMYKKLPYDPARGYTSIALFAEIPLGLMVKADSKFTSAKDFLGNARSNPSKVTYSTPGVAMIATLASHIAQDKAGITLQQVPYLGSTPAVQAVLAGQTDSAFVDIGSASPFLQAGGVRMLATATKNRVAQFPGVPTLVEAGIQDLSIPPVWFGLAGPPGMPPDIVNRWNDVANKVLKEPEMLMMLDRMVLTPMGGTPQQMDAQIRTDLAVWPAIIKKLGITLDH